MFTAEPLHRPMPAWPLRLVALACAVLVGLFSLGTVSPEIHAVLHDQPQDSCGHSESNGHSDTRAEPGHFCAVTLFSQGFESGCAPLVGLGAPAPLLTDVIALADQVARAARAAQLPPGRGPPVC